MLRKIGKTVILSLLTLFTITGCNAQNEAHETFLLFKAEGNNANFQNTGSLYIKKKDAEPTLISTDVLESGFQYENSSEEVVFVDKNHSLYLYDGEGSSVLIAEDVNDFRSSYLDQGKIFYHDLDSNLYVYWDGQTEMISDAAFHYDLVDNHVYYIEGDDLRVLNLETKEK